MRRCRAGSAPSYSTLAWPSCSATNKNRSVTKPSTAPWSARRSTCRAQFRLFVRNDEVETIGPRDEGEWAFFYLLAAGQNPSKSGDYVTVTYKIGRASCRERV